MLVLTVPAVSGCGQAVPAAPPPRDPVVAAALGDAIMTDPDLVGQNQSGSVFVLAGPPSAPIPLLDRGDEELAAARASAARLLDADTAAAPPPGTGLVTAPGRTLAITAATTLGELGLARGCTGSLRTSAIWAASLPPPLPVYPRGHVQNAAGSDAPGCSLRVVTFLTPVPLKEVADFYWNRAGQAGFAPRHDRTAAGIRIAATENAEGFAVFAAEREGATEVTLLTSGMQANSLAGPE